jgi:hypothetical protein
MNFTQCDSCGKVFGVKEKTWNPNFKYFTKFDLCYDCYRKLEDEWEAAFHNCGHDMKTFKEKKVEVATAICSKAAGSKKKK